MRPQAWHCLNTRPFSWYSCSWIPWPCLARRCLRFSLSWPVGPITNGWCTSFLNGFRDNFPILLINCTAFSCSVDLTRKYSWVLCLSSLSCSMHSNHVILATGEFICCWGECGELCRLFHDLICSLSRRRERILLVCHSILNLVCVCMSFSVVCGCRFCSRIEWMILLFCLINKHWIGNAN